jgi:hypothetical protein
VFVLNTNNLQNGKKMKTYKIALVVDEKWLEVIKHVTTDPYEDEVCVWVNVTERKIEVA